MTRDEITKVLLKHADRLKAMGATGLYIFGSRARGDNRPDSDLDLLIDLDEVRVKSYFDIFGVQMDIEEELGIPVQMVPHADLDSIIRHRVEGQAVQVF